jgi:hypothetical protein
MDPARRPCVQATATFILCVRPLRLYILHACVSNPSLVDAAFRRSTRFRPVSPAATASNDATPIIFPRETLHQQGAYCSMRRPQVRSMRAGTSRLTQREDITCMRIQLLASSTKFSFPMSKCALALLCCTFSIQPSFAHEVDRAYHGDDVYDDQYVDIDTSPRPHDRQAIPAYHPTDMVSISRLPPFQSAK